MLSTNFLVLIFIIFFSVERFVSLMWSASGDIESAENVVTLTSKLIAYRTDVELLPLSATDLRNFIKNYLIEECNRISLLFPRVSRESIIASIRDEINQITIGATLLIIDYVSRAIFQSPNSSGVYTDVHGRMYDLLKSKINSNQLRVSVEPMVATICKLFTPNLVDNAPTCLSYAFYFKLLADTQELRDTAWRELLTLPDRNGNQVTYSATTCIGCYISYVATKVDTMGIPKTNLSGALTPSPALFLKAEQIGDIHRVFTPFDLSSTTVVDIQYAVFFKDLRTIFNNNVTPASATRSTCR